MNAKQRRLVTSVTFVAFAALLLGPSSTLAVVAVAPPLGVAQSFAALGGAGVTGQAGAGGAVNGDVGSWPTPAISNFPPSQVLLPFFLHLTADPVVQTAQSDANAASLFLQAQGPGMGLAAQLGGTVVVPGVYSFTSTADVAANTTLTLSGSGIYVFLVGSSITANVGSDVVLTNGANSCNVFWQVVASATLNGKHFPGTVIAGASVTVGDNTIFTGRAVALVGAVTMPGNGGSTIGGCSGAAGTPPPAPPTLSKVFSLPTIDPNGVSTLTITLSNPNTSIATLTAALTDNLPANVVVAPTPNAITTCTGGVFTPSPSSLDTAVTLSAGAIPAGTSSMPGTCTVKVDVTSATPGSHLNTLPAGALMTSNGNNADAAQATLTVNPAVGTGVMAPTVGKSFNLATISSGGTSTLTIILSNSSSDMADTITTLTDNLPTGVVIATPNGASTTCAGGTLTATAGTGTITLSGGAVPVGVGTTAGTCTVTVNVTATLGGTYVNTIAAGDLVTNNGNNADAAIATLTVNPVPPTLSKRFVRPTIIAGGVSTLTITLSNPNTLAATNAALLDALPSGVTIAAPLSTSNTCGGTLTATPGTGIILLSGGTIPAGDGITAGTCTVTVKVTAVANGSFTNTLPPNALQTSNGNNPVPASATLTVTTLPAPMLSGGAMIMLMVLLALVGFAAVRRQAM